MDRPEQREREQAIAAMRAVATTCREGVLLLRKYGAEGPWSELAAELERHAEAMEKSADHLARQLDTMRRGG